MKKTESKDWPNVPYRTWKYEEQTKMKHKVFGYYLPLWLQILGRWSKNLNYVDGFGGLGAYHDEEDVDVGSLKSRYFGSPILSMMEIASLENKNRIEKANVLIIDQDKENIKNIEEIVNFLKIKINGAIIYRNENFDKEINNFLDQADKSKTDLAPTFFLIDPFGFADIKLQTLKRIMSRDRTEVLLNFMYNSLQHWITHPDEKINKIYDEYFGGDEWRKCQTVKLSEREVKLVEIFRNKCKEFCKYVYPFKLKFPHKNKTYYYLFHLTQYWKGCALMKDSFAKFNDGKPEYKGENPQKSMLEPIEKKEKEKNFSNKLKEKYKSKTINFRQVFEDLIDETDLLQKDIGKEVGFLENDKKIGVKSCDGRKRRGGFKEDDLLIFN